MKIKVIKHDCSLEQLKILKKILQLYKKELKKGLIRISVYDKNVHIFDNDFNYFASYLGEIDLLYIETSQPYPTRSYYNCANGRKMEHCFIRIFSD